MASLAIRYLSALLSLGLVACQSTDRPNPTIAKEAIDQALAADEKVVPPPVMPESVSRELGANQTQVFAPPMPQERRFDVAANDVDARIFFPSLVQGSPFSMAVHPDVQGKITLSLKGVTLSEVLQVVEDLYGFEVNRDGRVLTVFPAGMRTETFPVNYLYMERMGMSFTSVTSGRISDSNNNNNGYNGDNGNFNGNNSNGNGFGNNNQGNGNVNSYNNDTNGTFIQSRTNTDFWGELKKTLESLIGGDGSGRNVVVMPQAGLVTVRAQPNELRQVRAFLTKTETHLQRQVILEAKVLEVTLSDGYQQGIQWQQIAGSALAGGNVDVDFSTNAGVFGDKITNNLGGITSLSFKGSDFSAMITLLDTQGDVDVLSSPRVTASNNQKAVIKVGTDEYFVTDVSSTTVAGTTPITTPNVQLTPFFSGIALDVTPQIDGQGNVLLHVHPSVIDVKEQTKQIKLSDTSLELPLAQSEIRESDTVIKAASGDVVVIGGLMKSENMELISRVPVLGNIPLIGEVFTNRNKVNRKTELVILLKPTVVVSGTWAKEMERSKALLDRWYPEGQ